MISGGEGEVVPGVASLGTGPQRLGDAAAQWRGSRIAICGC